MNHSFGQEFWVCWAWQLEFEPTVVMMHQKSGKNSKKESEKETETETEKEQVTYKATYFYN